VFVLRIQLHVGLLFCCAGNLLQQFDALTFCKIFHSNMSMAEGNGTITQFFSLFTYIYIFTYLYNCIFCVTSWKIMGSILDGGIGVCH
jgi:hypothetical protein